jgi:hypothetical protein
VQPSHTQRELITTAEVASLLDITPRHVMRLAAAGKITPIPLSKKFTVFKRCEVVQLVKPHGLKTA